MGILLGIDTGGTFTDAVLFDEEKGVLHAAKSLTTKHDLSIGLNGAAQAVLNEAVDIKPEDVKLVSISTTLATNAIVEDHGNPVALLLIGQPPATLERAGLKTVMGSDPVIFIEGGHTASGDEKCPLDVAALEEALDKIKGKVSAFAIAGYFATRNPAHEIQAREIIREQTGLPITCAHELSSNLDAPRRALTAVLNARLIPLLQHLIEAVQDFQQDIGLECPLMVVKGDGSLISADTALSRPVETILSGPAASVVGAQHQVGQKDMVVSDMGGTTTDIALLKDGLPVLNKNGAVVAGHRTMVEAVEVHTVGLGGDSEIRLDDEKNLVAGPRRVVPISLLACDYDFVVPTLKEQLERGWRKTYDGKFAIKLRDLPEDQRESLSRTEEFIYDKLSEGPMSLEKLLGRQVPDPPLRRLVDRGLVIISAFTPSDASHLKGLHDSWNKEAAELAAAIWADTEKRPDQMVAEDALDFAEKVWDLTVIQTGEALIDSILDSRIGLTVAAGQGLAKQLIRESMKAEKDRLLPMIPSMALAEPLVGIGAPARSYYGEVAKRLSTEYIEPEFAHVSNAVGAVAGGVAQRAELTVTAPDDMRFRIHGAGEQEDSFDLEETLEKTKQLARMIAHERAVNAGAGDIEIRMEEEIRQANTGGSDKPIFIEAKITATAIGRPNLG
ncbi:hydantoinase/oxoprolinase N-terminal domain-containing protein [Curvivirga aplysinae]|uniref:hydantoinase/oxoprolinase N-terminal domain-containing protein n=1 Tax=Curvivirga aplysinae TaxID=2529852 RepID=UPI0012BB981C|nr:hydantoinase/oxoprolinase family protein [Curvivirga aplysinae]MTI09148.1 hydantoinase/oxoprolinase family protein [Curvivirga aplysinae]